MMRRRIHVGELVWIIQLICIAIDLAFWVLFQSNALQISFLRVNPLISRVSIALGAILFASGGFVGYQSHAAFNRALSKSGQVQDLIKDGLYRFCRHPFYLSQIIICLSLIFLFRSYILLVGWLVVTGILVREAREEEVLLIEAFGEAYLAYQCETGFFFKRFFPKVICDTFIKF